MRGSATGILPRFGSPLILSSFSFSVSGYECRHREINMY